MPLADTGSISKTGGYISLGTRAPAPAMSAKREKIYVEVGSRLFLTKRTLGARAGDGARAPSTNSLTRLKHNLWREAEPRADMEEISRRKGRAFPHIRRQSCKWHGRGF